MNDPAYRNMEKALAKLKTYIHTGKVLELSDPEVAALLIAAKDWLNAKDIEKGLVPKL